MDLTASSGSSEKMSMEWDNAGMPSINSEQSGSEFQASIVIDEFNEDQAKLDSLQSQLTEKNKVCVKIVFIFIKY